MRVLSINVSAVREIGHGGRTVRTGFFKRSVDGPVEVGRINLAGDDQADRVHHGGEHKAVYAFAAGEYPHWRDALGRDDLASGAFGENLTVAGLDEEHLRVGDRLRGGTCLFEITQPRVPCFKLGIALGAEGAPRRFIERARPGVYLRVLEPGSIRAGDGLRVESSAAADGADGGEADGVATLYRAAFDTSLEAVHRLEVIERVLAIAALSGEWTAFLTKRRATLGRTGRD